MKILTNKYGKSQLSTKEQVNRYNLEVYTKEQVNRKNLVRYNFKILEMGKILKVYEYEKPVMYGYQKNAGRKVSEVEVTKKETRVKVLHRIRNDIINLSISNFDNKSKFITLTFEKNVKNLKVANREFKKFIQRLKYKYGDIKYLAVIEFQGRGAVHYHMLSDLKYVENRDLRDIWRNGFVKINRIKHVDNIGAYIVKYTNKNCDDVRLHKRKAYLRSENLKKPKVLIGRNAIEFAEKNKLLKEMPVYMDAYFSEHYGLITFREYNLKRAKKFRKKKGRYYCKN